MPECKMLSEDKLYLILRKKEFWEQFYFTGMGSAIFDNYKKV